MHTDYATTFRLPPSATDKVVEMCRTWLDSTSLPADLTDDGHARLRDMEAAWSRDDGSFELRFTRGTGACAATVTLETFEERGKTRVIVGRSWRAPSGEPVGPRRIREVPALAAKLASSGLAHDGPVPVSAIAPVVGAGDVGTLAEELTCAERRLPMLVISPGRHGAALPPEAATMTLTGLAHVRVLDTQFSTSRALSAAVGERRSCFGGAARLYWPGFTADANPHDHRFWTPDTLRSDRARILGWIRHELVAQHAARTCRRAAAPASASAAEASRAASASQRDVDELHARIAELEAQLEQATQEPARDGSSQFATVGHATRQAAADFPQLAWCDDAFDEADKSPFCRPDHAYDVLATLADAARRYARNELDGGWYNFFTAAGVQYSPDVSEVARSRWPGEYQRRWNGRDVWIGPHLKVGTGPPDRCLRVYWHVDERARQVVVGHVGRHLTDTASNGR